jgi:hypothetical protein
MRVLEGDQDAVDDATGLARVERTLGHDVFQEPPVDVLHDDEGHLDLVPGGIADRLFTGVEHADDRRVRHARGGLRLLAEAGAEGRIVGEGGLQQLDRDSAAQPGIHADMHVGHAAATEELTDLVAAGEQADVCRHPICHDRLFPCWSCSVRSA